VVPMGCLPLTRTRRCVVDILPIDRIMRLSINFTEMWFKWGDEPPPHAAREMADTALEIARLHDEESDHYRQTASKLASLPGFATED
jgi:hypothetical protein